MLARSGRARNDPSADASRTEGHHDLVTETDLCLGVDGVGERPGPADHVDDDVRRVRGKVALHLSQ